MLGHCGDKRQASKGLLYELHCAAVVHMASGERHPEAASPRDALDLARRLTPDCVDIVATLGNAFAASWMYADAEHEFCCAQCITIEAVREDARAVEELVPIAIYLTSRLSLTYRAVPPGVHGHVVGAQP